METLSSIASGAAALADRITSGTTTLVVVSNTGFISLTQAGTTPAGFDPSRGLVTLGVSATGGISGTTGYFSDTNMALHLGNGSAVETFMQVAGGRANLVLTQAQVHILEAHRHTV